MVKLGQAHVEQANAQDSVQLQLVGADALPALSSAGPFDAALCAFVLHHAYKHMDNILSTLHAVLKPNSKLYIFDTDATDLAKCSTRLALQKFTE
jgi:ubiquinone/menaquinone biosynthesis C-methylase UbiE